MKKLKLILNGCERLTREQMKNITGGVEYPGCIFYNNDACGGGTRNMVYTDSSICTDACSCQDHVDSYYANDDCCDNIDCGCQ